MDKSTKKLYSEKIAKEAEKLFGIKITEEPKGFENFIFPAIGIDDEKKEYILRISHAIRRTPDLIEGEADYVHFLKSNGINVPEFYKSINGNFAEELSNGFVACLMEKAQGGFSNHDNLPNLQEEMGRFMAKYHDVGLDFKNTRGRRFDMAENIWRNREIFDQDDTEMLARYDDISNQILALPKDETYQYIHLDFHRGNFFVHDNQITLFDWDDSIISWHSHDLAVSILYFSPPTAFSGQDSEITQELAETFVKAYLEVRPISSQWLKTLPLFIQYREVILYAVIIRSIGKDPEKGWPKIFMHNRRENLLANKSILPLNYGRIAELA